MSAKPRTAARTVNDLKVDDIVPNLGNPRLDFPQDELDRLSDSIDTEGVLVPIVVYQKGDKYVLVDGERRFRCARDLGLEYIPALITEERSEREMLAQMFNIHLIREPWRDIPTAKALQRLVETVKAAGSDDPSDQELSDLTGLSVERIRQLRYVITLPDEWQDLIRDGTVPLNYFWELKKVVDTFKARRPQLLEEFGEEGVRSSFVQKRLDGVVTDTVSLRKIGTIIKFAQQIAAENGTGESEIDQSLRDLVNNTAATIDHAYEDTVQMMVEVDRLERRAHAMIAVFSRLLSQTTEDDEKETIHRIGQALIKQLSDLLDVTDRSREK